MIPNDAQSIVPEGICMNCSTALMGTYCHTCGQHRRDSSRLALRQVFARLLEGLLNLDSALLRTFIGLTIRPSSTCRDYVEGRRKRFMNPFGYFVLAGTGNLRTN